VPVTTTDVTEPETEGQKEEEKKEDVAPKDSD